MIFLSIIVVLALAATWYVFGMAAAVGVLFACPLFFVVFAVALIAVADLMHRHMEPDAPASWRRRQHLRQWRLHAVEMGYRGDSPLKPSTKEWADYEAVLAATSISKRAGRVMNWICTGVAVPIYLSSLTLYVFSGREEPRIYAGIGIAVAAAVWSIGKASRYILANEY